MEINKIEIGNEINQLSQNMGNSAPDISFEEQLFNEISNVNNNIVNAEENIQNLALGKNENLHEVMLSIQSAKLSLEMLMKVRDKTLEGVHEILRMQI